MESAFNKYESLQGNIMEIKPKLNFNYSVTNSIINIKNKWFEIQSSISLYINLQFSFFALYFFLASLAF